MIHLKFRSGINHKKTGDMALSSHVDCVIVALIVSKQYQAVTDRRTNGWTDGIYHNWYSALHSKWYWHTVKIWNLSVAEVIYKSAKYFLTFIIGYIKRRHW